MAEHLRIRYVESAGFNVAYHLEGDGPVDVLGFSFGVLPIDSVGEEPRLARFNRRLATFSRIVRFDVRGVGSSDPVAPDQVPTLEDWADDARRVLDEVGIERAAVLAPRDAAPAGIVFAARHPERTASLIIINGMARLAWSEDYPIGTPSRVFDQFLDTNLKADAVDRGFDWLSVAAPSAASDPEFRAWWDRAGNRGASPATARRLLAVQQAADVRHLLPALAAPTLVMHMGGERIFRVEHGRYLAEHIDGARYVELEGADSLYWAGETDVMLDEIEDFLTGVRQGPRAESVLATVLFTDIVDSTTRLAEMGDRRWAELLDRMDASARRQVERFRGRIVKSTGDGLLAVFDGPARAVLCALALRDSASEIGVDIRAGLHTGEIEVRGDDVAGMPVHIASRIESLAGPGEVLVSRTLSELTTGSGITMTERGEHELKGVPGRWLVYAAGA